jgi:hypothetical protein
LSAHLYAAENKVVHSVGAARPCQPHIDAGRDEMLVCIICATRPTRLLDGSPPITMFTNQSPGLYVTQTLIPCHVIVTSELPIESVNYPLLVFTTGRKRKEFILEMIARDEVELIKVARLLYPRDVKEGYKMAKKPMEIDLVENLRVIKEDVGAEELLKAFTVEERLAGLTAEEVAQLREAIDRLFPNGKTNSKKKRRRK